MANDPLTGFSGSTVERDVPCTVRDGTTLLADVYRPRGGEPRPVLLIRLPYDKQAALANFGYAHPAWFAEHGYMVVVQDCRGRYRSDGEFTPFQDEAIDGYDTVEWAARLPGADGRVAMYGFSYCGATSLMAATAAPPSLATICPGFTGSQYYDGWTYQSGALNLAFVMYWSTLLGLDAAKRAGDGDGYALLGEALQTAPSWFGFLPTIEYPVTGEHAPYFRDWVEHATYDDYWRRWSIDERYDAITVPALHVGGWYDIFLRGTVRNFVGLTGAPRAGPQKLLLGPWTHMPWAPVDTAGGTVSTNEVDDWQLRWLDHHLRGIDTGVLDEPVTAYVLGDGMRNFASWPPEEATHVDFHLHSKGRAASKFGDGTLDRYPPADEPPDVFIYDPATPIPSLGGHSCCFDSVTPMGPADQHVAEISRMVLVYTSDTLAEDLRIVGDVYMTLYAASTAVDTDFTARLCVVDPSGTSTNVQEGIVRARYRDSLAEPSPITPGRVYRYTIDLGSVALRVPAGSSIRLDISSSDFPQWDRNLNTGGPIGREGALAARTATQTVLHSERYPSSLSLPLLLA